MTQFLFAFFKKINHLLQGRDWGAFVPGLRPLHHFLLTMLKPKGIVATTIFGRTLFVDMRDSGEANEIILNGCYSPYETEIFRSLIKPGMKVADIGAHIGYFTLLAADAVGAHGRVYAFEPDPRNFDLLSRTVSVNHFENVILEHKAISDNNGSGILFRDRFNLGNMSFAEHNIPRDAFDGSIKVDTRTLDGYFSGLPLDILKVDVQGAEGRVFTCGRETLNKVRFVLTEFWPFGLRNMGTEPRAFLEMFIHTGFSFRLLNEGAHTMKKKTVDELLSLSRNRPEGKGWANILCTREM